MDWLICIIPIIVLIYIHVAGYCVNALQNPDKSDYGRIRFTLAFILLILLTFWFAFSSVITMLLLFF